MVQEFYRIQWKDTKGKWKYVNGEMLIKVMGPDFIPSYSSEQMKNLPFLFTSRQKAESVTRALSDLKEVSMVSLREESSILDLKGAGYEEEKKGETKKR